MFSKRILSVSFPRYMKNGDISKFSTVHIMSMSCFRNVFYQSVFHDTWYTMILVSFPHHTQCLLMNHTVTRSFPHHTQCLLMNHTMSVDDSHGDPKFSTSHTMSVDETRDDPKLSTSHRISNVCWRNTRWPEAFHGALKPTISFSCPQYTRYSKFSAVH